MKYVFYALIISLLVWTACHSPEVPKKSTTGTGNSFSSVPVSVRDLHVYKEKDQIFVTGICDNKSAQWQAIIVTIGFESMSGKQVLPKTPTQVVLLSPSVPPSGASAFFGAWNLSDFSEIPDTAYVEKMEGQLTPAGTILVSTGTSGLRLLANGDTEKAWQAKTTIINATNQTAHHPMTEVWIYGTDQKLWFASSIDPQDPALSQVVKLDNNGKLPPGSRSDLNCIIYYENLPKALQTQKIGRVTFQPYDVVNAK